MIDIIPQDDAPEKQCPRCKQYKTASNEFFHRRSKAKDGLQTYCKQCAAEKLNQYYHAPAKPVIPDGYKKCFTCKEIFPATTEFFHAYSRKKDGLWSNCKKCRSASRSQHRRDNREAYRVRDRSDYKRHEEQRRQHTRRYRERYRREHPLKPRIIDGKKQCTKCGAWKPVTWEYFDAQKSKKSGLRSHCKDCRARDRYASEAKSPEQRRAIWHKRVERERRAEGHYTHADIRKQLARQKNLCYYCRRKLTKYHADHIIPLSRGGTNWPDNIVLACPHCNLSKGSRLLHEWFEGGKLL